MRGRNVLKAPAMRARELGISALDRRAAGGVVTLREVASGATLVRHVKGRAWATGIAELADSLPGDWRVVSISTPATVYRDLQGTRKHPWTDSVQFPEAGILGKIDRLDLLDASLAPAMPEKRR